MNKQMSKPIVTKNLAFKTRMSLKDVGLSLDEHIYNYEKIVHRKYCKKESVVFLNNLHNFYTSLNDFEKKLFVYEILEEGRHFKYWYEEYRTRKTYLKAKRKLIKKTEESFYEV